MMKCCPNCKVLWEQEQTIYEHFLSLGHEDARELAAMYGCTPDSPKHFGTNVVGIEYPEYYDGVYEWYCLNCEHSFPRPYLVEKANEQKRCASQPNIEEVSQTRKE